MQSVQREPRLIGHLEKYLGRIVEGWSVDAKGVNMPFQVARFDFSTIRNCRAFATLGLSGHALRSRQSGRGIRLELLMLVRGSERSMGIPSLLQGIGIKLVQNNMAVLRGEVVGPHGPLWIGSPLEALYATSPAYLGDGAAAFELEDGSRCALVWLVPITADESVYVRSHGWEAFEEALVREDPDLLSTTREGMRVCAL
jgi:hypothetical protein